MACSHILEVDAPTPPPTPKARKAWSLWLLLGSLLVLALPAFYLLENYLGARLWQQVLAEMRAAGAPTSPSELAGPPIPDEENFAAIPLFRPLFEFHFPPSERDKPFPEPHWLRPTDLDGLNGRVWLAPGLRISSKGNWKDGRFRVSETVASFSPDFPEMVEELRAGVERPHGQFPLHAENLLHARPFQPQPAHITIVSRIGDSLSEHILAALAHGRTDMAARDLALGLRLAETLENEPLLSPLEEGIRQLDQLLQSVWEGQVRHQWNDSQLALLESALRRHEVLGAFRRALHGEILARAQLCDSFKHDRTAITPYLWYHGSPVLPSSHLLEAQLAVLSDAWLDFTKAYLARAELRLSALIDPVAHRVDPLRVQQELRDFDTEFDRTLNPRKALVTRLRQSSGFIAPKITMAAADIDLARVALALERHRLAHGAWPKTLAELAPRYLPAVPHDLITGAPLRYRIGPGADFTLYSVGWDGLDDGGKIAPNNPFRGRVEGDWVWPRPAEIQSEP